MSAACLLSRTMHLRNGKEGTLNHPRHDRRTPHTGLPVGVQGAGLPALGVSDGSTRHKTGTLRLSPLVLTGFTTVDCKRNAVAT
ncbi:hypothetical protein NQZ68_031551 [Dissostichus eleginoides]|nr:hypothetical protein NQZ68_031551 [Dissostichus eleginoides]